MFAIHDRKFPTLGWVLLLSGFLTTVPAAAEDFESAGDGYGADTSYSYARVIEGPSTVLEVGGDRESVEAHRPILVGDRLWVPHGSRLEVVLADRNLLRFDGESQLVFEGIALSADTADRVTVLGLSEGEVQLVVPEDALGDALPQIRTPDGTLYIHRQGSFRIRVGPGWTELVVREGLAEMVTDRGSLLVHPGEAGWFEGGARPRIEVRLAGRRDGLERWGDRLSDEARLAAVPYVDSSLRYVAAPLASHGAWIEIGGRWAWRPRVEVVWRPYYRGYWRYTPIGLTWVSYDPWGYVTHHYGSWDHVGGYGWVWYPGRIYAPARVYWYWGPRYVGWCPSGYYGHYYRHRHAGFGLHFGTYGWAGGSWGNFRYWTFSLSLDFARHPHRHHDHGDRYRDDRRHYRIADDLARERRELERGIITTDPGRERRQPGERYAELERRMTEISRVEGRELPDVTGFVARRPLEGDVAAVVLSPQAAVEGSSKPSLSAGDWTTGAKPLPTLAESARRGAEKPSASAPTYRELSEPSKPPRVSTPAPRIVRPQPSKPVPQVSRPESSKPSPRVSTPEPSTPAPRIVRPQPSKPPPQVSLPDASKPSPQVSKPSPQVSKPSPQVSKPSPQVSKPSPQVLKPSPQVSKPSPQVSKPAPQVSKPAPQATKPAPQATKPAPPQASKPAPPASKPQPSKPGASASESKDSDSEAKASSESAKDGKKKKKKKD